MNEVLYELQNLTDVELRSLYDQCIQALTTGVVPEGSVLKDYADHIFEHSYITEVHYVANMFIREMARRYEAAKSV